MSTGQCAVMLVGWKALRHGLFRLWMKAWNPGISCINNKYNNNFVCLAYFS